MDLNRVTLIGRSGAKGELRYLPSGMALCEISIATSKNTAKQGMEPVWVSTWHKVTCWGKLAEQVAPRINKGSTVFVEGELQMREWEKDGVKRQAWSVNARIVEVIDKRNPENPNANVLPSDDQGSMNTPFDPNDDLPF